MRSLVFALLSALGIGAAVLAARLSGVGSPDNIIVGVEALSSSSSGLLDRLASLLPLGFAFGAGMVSAANPCGFAMLPAYLALFLGRAAEERGPVAGRIGRGLLVSAAVTMGFILLFAGVGLTIAAGAHWLAIGFPWLGLGTGVLLLLTGAWLASGGTIATSFGDRLAVSIGRVDNDHRTARDFFMFGLAYGLASLSCTLPVFLAVLGSTLTLGTLPATVVQLLLYALGMGAVVTLLTLSVAAFESAVIARVRTATRYVAPLGSILLLGAGGYLIYYWLTVGGLLAAFA